MAAMKTPGVYVVEKNAFPNGVVEVATAVPAFIGYTEIAELEGRSLTNKAHRITSLTQFIKCFGMGPSAEFKLSATAPAKGDAKAGDAPAADAPAGDAKAEPAKGLTYNYNGTVCTLEQTSKLFNLFNSIRLFYQNSGGPCYIVSVGNYDKAIAGADLTAGIKPLIKEQEPTMVLIPEAISLEQADCQSVQQQMLNHCGSVMKNRIAIVDVLNGDQAQEKCIESFRNDIGTNFLDYATSYYPWLHTSIVQDAEVNYGNLDADSVKTLGEQIKAELIKPAKDAAPAKEGEEAKAAEPSAKDKQITQIIEDMAKTDADPVQKAATHNSLMAISGLYKMTMGEIKASLNLLPPSSAMAGVYTMVDNSIGVWKAPANVSLNSVVKPAVEISNAEQEDLNMPINGKAVNAIRSFIGEGVLVWGARTLDGNSLDWRYVNVRRTMIMLEESIRLACKAYVFEPNTANTWVTIKGMIGSFLNGVWKQGGLAGAAPADAYSVNVGLGATMDPEDILNGILRVTVLVAISRPAEFIEITFQQQMQKS